MLTFLTQYISNRNCRARATITSEKYAAHSVLTFLTVSLISIETVESVPLSAHVSYCISYLYRNCRARATIILSEKYTAHSVLSAGRAAHSVPHQLTAIMYSILIMPCRR